MSVEFRRPRRPAWLYPVGTIIRTRYGRFRVRRVSTPIGIPGGASWREWGQVDEGRGGWCYVQHGSPLGGQWNAIPHLHPQPASATPPRPRPR